MSEEELGSLLFPLIQRRSEIIGYTNDDLYNFAVYYWNSNRKCLEIAFRQCDDRIVIKNRSWKPGHGHVGECYIKEKTIFTRVEAKDSDLINAFGYTEIDLRYYCATVSTPIFESKNPTSPLGVLNITSSNGNQFKENDLDRKEDWFFVETYAKLLSIYFENRRII